MIYKTNLKIFNIMQQIWFQGSYYDGKIPHTIGTLIFPLICGFGIGYSIGQKYRPIWASVLDLYQNSVFGRTLIHRETRHQLFQCILCTTTSTLSYQVGTLTWYLYYSQRSKIIFEVAFLSYILWFSARLDLQISFQ